MGKQSKAPKKEMILHDRAALDFQEQLLDLLADYPALLPEEDWESLKLKVRRENGTLAVKFRWKPPKASAAAEEAGGGAWRQKKSGLPRYKILKKRMKADFSEIGGRIARGEMPDAATAGRFIADSRLMILYPNKGDEYYGEYETALERFVTSLKQKNPADLRSSYNELNRFKVRCHKVHK